MKGGGMDGSCLRLNQELKPRSLPDMRWTAKRLQCRRGHATGAQGDRRTVMLCAVSVHPVAGLAGLLLLTALDC